MSETQAVTREQALEQIGKIFPYKGEEWKIIGVEGKPGRDMPDGIYLVLSLPGRKSERVKVA